MNAAVWGKQFVPGISPRGQWQPYYDTANIILVLIGRRNRPRSNEKTHENRHHPGQNKPQANKQRLLAYKSLYTKYQEYNTTAGYV